MGLCLRRGLASALLLALLPACAGCRDPRQAETLDRPTALTLLREQGEAALRGPTWSIDLVVYDTDPAEAARLAFLKNLAPTLVKLTITEEVEAPGFSLSPTKRPRAKRYEFEPAEPKTAPHLLRGEMMKIARFAIADPGYQKVTGIVQEGSQAVATVEVRTRRTRHIGRSRARSRPPGRSPALRSRRSPPRRSSQRR
jgi:hypothetical protein